jgi:hypothetical protein
MYLQVCLFNKIYKKLFGICFAKEASGAPSWASEIDLNTLSGVMEAQPRTLEAQQRAFGLKMEAQLGVSRLH